jgi:NAD(P)-dependent dehydrogenase (short-subunit alcohol dehydrogenase family)
MNLKGRVVVITGATGGLGRVVARTFAEQGASLALLSSDPSKLDALMQELALAPEQHMVHGADLRKADAVQEAAQAVVARFGAIHILLHLVGGWVGGKTIVESQADDLASMLDQHVWTTFHLLQAFVPHLSASGWGRVMVVSSPVATRPSAKSGAYAIAKAAEEAMLLTLSEEVKAKGVTANILQVKAIDVEHQRETTPTPANASWTTPEEITSAMLYLCSEAAGMVNGTRLPLFGKGV